MTLGSSSSCLTDAVVVGGTQRMWRIALLAGFGPSCPSLSTVEPLPTADQGAITGTVAGRRRRGGRRRGRRRRRKKKRRRHHHPMRMIMRD